MWHLEGDRQMYLESWKHGIDKIDDFETIHYLRGVGTYPAPRLQDYSSLSTA